jgi:hypothetical protein
MPLSSEKAVFSSGEAVLSSGEAVFSSETDEFLPFLL